MKKINLFLFLSLFAFNINAQSFTQLAISGTQIAISGGFDAVLQADQFYPTKVVKAFPNYQLAKDTYSSKYKNGDPAQGDAYFLSSKALVVFVDPFHRTQFIRNALVATSPWPYMIKAEKNWYKGEKEWYHWGAEIMYHWACFNIGKELTFQYIKSQ